MALDNYTITVLEVSRGRVWQITVPHARIKEISEEINVTYKYALSMWAAAMGLDLDNEETAYMITKDPKIYTNADFSPPKDMIDFSKM